jgi:gamma-glutamyl phosphate reductase
MRINGVNIVIASFVDGHKVPVLKIATGEAHVFVNGSPSEHIKVFWDESRSSQELSHIMSIRKGVSN